MRGAPDGDSVEILRYEALQERRGLGSFDDDEITRNLGLERCTHVSPKSRWAAAAAVSNARALFRHSRSSSSGTESATIPAPACSVARPSRQNIVRIAIAVSRLPEKST